MTDVPDRGAVRRPDAAQDEGRPGGAPASGDDLVLAITSVWTQITGIEPIEPDDDFFELGGSSLMATQVIAELRNVLGVEMSLQTFFQHPTAARLAGELEHRLAGRGEDASGPGREHDHGVL